MSIDVQWGDAERSFLLLDFQGAWTWDELDAAHERIADLLAGITYRVHYLLDVRGSYQVPNRISINSKANGARPDHALAGVTVVVGANAFTRTLLDGMIPVTGSETVLLAESIAEAVALFAEYA